MTKKTTAWAIVSPRGKILAWSVSDTKSGAWCTLFDTDWKDDRNGYKAIKVSISPILEDE